MGITFAKPPIASLRARVVAPLPFLVSRLSRPQQSRGKVMVCLLYVVELVSRIPMESNSSGILGGSGMRVQCLRPIVDIILVVVEHEDIDVWMRRFQCGAKVIP